MPNTNCLEGVRCPKCGHEDSFIIAARIDVLVTDDGTDDTRGDYTWEDDSFCACDNCNHHGTVLDFSTDHQDHLKRRDFSKLRERLGWTCWDAARALEIDLAKIALWESGKEPAPHVVCLAMQLLHDSNREAESP